MELTDVAYEAVTCPPDLAAGRIGGALGTASRKEIVQQCVRVTATATNPTKQALENVAVFGFVIDEQAGASVVPNNQDLRSDAGQVTSSFALMLAVAIQ